MLKKLLIVIVPLVIAFSAWRVFTNRQDRPESNNQQSQQAGFDKSQHSTDQPGSLWWVVNKNRPLPDGYAPGDLVEPDVAVRGSTSDENKISQPVAAPVKDMFDAAKRDGHDLLFVSGYRSYALQVSVYNQNVKQLGQSEADHVSAKPGTSEHQTGLSFDVGAADRKCEIETCFEDTPEGQWIAAHAHEYGFIIRYPQDKQAITGYSYEPWHLRYVGKELAAELQKTPGQTLEEFFSL